MILNIFCISLCFQSKISISLPFPSPEMSSFMLLMGFRKMSDILIYLGKFNTQFYIQYYMWLIVFWDVTL
jgi:hypothetical protein